MYSNVVVVLEILLSALIVFNKSMTECKKIIEDILKLFTICENHLMLFGKRRLNNKIYFLL